MIKIYIRFPFTDITSKYEKKNKVNSFNFRSNLLEHPFMHSSSFFLVKKKKKYIQEFVVIGS